MDRISSSVRYNFPDITNFTFIFRVCTSCLWDVMEVISLMESLRTCVFQLINHWLVFSIEFRRKNVLFVVRHNTSFQNWGFAKRRSFLFQWNGAPFVYDRAIPHTPNNTIRLNFFRNSFFSSAFENVSHGSADTFQEGKDYLIQGGEFRISRDR